MNRYAVIYVVTLFVLVPLDFLFLGIVAKDFFTSQVGNMLGEIKLAPAVLFYLLYVVGIVIFVSGGADATWQSTLLYGALFGLFCYATFDLTTLGRQVTGAVGPHPVLTVGHPAPQLAGDDLVAAPTAAEADRCPPTLHEPS